MMKNLKMMNLPTRIYPETLSEYYKVMREWSNRIQNKENLTQMLDFTSEFCKSLYLRNITNEEFALDLKNILSNAILHEYGDNNE